MASYQTPVIMMPTQQPFNMMQNPLINAYATAMMKQNFADMSKKREEKQRTDNISKFEAFARSQGKETRRKLTPSGLSVEEVAPAKVTDDVLKMAGKGLASDEENALIKSRLNPNKYDIAINNPEAGMSLADGSVGDVSGNEINPTAMDTRKYLQGVLNAPKPVKDPEIPDEFKSDIASIRSELGDNTDNIASALVGLKLKYASHPKTVSVIDKLLKDYKDEKISTESDPFARRRKSQ